VVVDAVLSLDQADLNERNIGIKKVPGGGLQDSLYVDGVAFKKTVRLRLRWVGEVVADDSSSHMPVSSSSQRSSRTPKLSC
jgi:hypothetical protein